MEKRRIIALIIFSLVLILGTSSCTVFIPGNFNQQRGSFKNPHKPPKPHYKRTIKLFKTKGKNKIKLHGRKHADSFIDTLPK